MEKSDYLRTADEVSVKIIGPDGSELYQSTASGYHSIESAVESTLGNASLSVNPEDCVFDITNLSTGVGHRYRINAHGHLRLIV